MNYKDTIERGLYWSTVSKQHGIYSKISDKVAISSSCKECPWCSTKLILANNKHEFELLEELIKKQTITIEFDLVSKSKDAALN